MGKLELIRQPSFLGKLLGGDELEPIDYKTFKEVLRYFSDLKIVGELSHLDEVGFKADLIESDPEILVDFIEQSIMMPKLHPFIFLLLFEVIKTLSLQKKIAKEKYVYLCDKLLKEKGGDISKFYDLKRVKIIYLLG